MKILEGHEKEYKDWYDKNSDGYGRACFTYAERWAEMLENKIESSTEDVMKVIVDNADKLSHEADTEGITGHMYGCAVSILSQCWKYGEYLRKWHNKEYNYDGDGVVNPAILTIGKRKGDLKMMNFGQAIEALKNGKKVARVGWNGKGMFLYMTTGSVVHLDEMKSETANYLRSFCKDKCMDEIEICPHIDMKTADNKLVIGWLASQTDMLAEDWDVVE